MTVSARPSAEEPPAGAKSPEPEAIFIVGVPRSGTTLMRMVLGKHSRIAIADENHFLGHFLPWVDAGFDFRRIGDLDSDEAVRDLVAAIYSERFLQGTWVRGVSYFWKWLVKSVPREELERRLLEGERSPRGVFTAVLRAYADHQGRAIMGEKTPAHYRQVELLLEWYPDARIVHMLRDPRAVYRSELKRRRARPETFPYRYLNKVAPLMQAFVLLAVIRTWADAVRRHRRYVRRYPDRYRLVRFEDLVRDPDVQVRQLCEFLGVEFEPAMLEQKVVSRGDRLGEAGFDAEAADRWRGSLSTLETRVLGSLLGGRIREMGYPRA